MTSFKEYILTCIAEKSDIIVQMEHLSSVTFDDICVLIHYITTQNIKIRSSTEVEKYLNCDACLDGAIVLKDVSNNEELVILTLLVSCMDGTPITVFLPATPGSKMLSIHKMSNKFVRVAKYYKIRNYPITQTIIVAFGIDYEYNSERAAYWLKHYTGGLIDKKSI